MHGGPAPACCGAGAATGGEIKEPFAREYG
jgi:hypothetical protein